MFRDGESTVPQKTRFSQYQFSEFEKQDPRCWWSVLVLNLLCFSKYTRTLQGVSNYSSLEVKGGVH